MSFNGTGTFTATTSGVPVTTNTVISSTVFNNLVLELSTGLSTCIAKDGQTVTTARIPFLLGINSQLTTDATSATTGSIISSGGISCAKALVIGTGAKFSTSSLADIVLNNSGAALATNATVGFTFLGTCAGTPTGVPTSYTGAKALIYDTTNDIFYIYNGSWKQINMNVPNIQEFTASGTWTLPSGWTTAFLEVHQQGPGGGGGGGQTPAATNGGGGGGAGEYKRTLLTATANQTVTINAAGTAGSAGADGGAGGSTVFGSITAAGGNGGISGNTTSAGGAQVLQTGVVVTNKADWWSPAGTIGLGGGNGGGSSSNGSVGQSIPGYYPAGTGGTASATRGGGGSGAASRFAAGANGGNGNNSGAGVNGTAGSLGSGGGGGGAGSSGSASSGGAGGGGYVLVYSWKLN